MISGSFLLTDKSLFPIDVFSQIKTLSIQFIVAIRPLRIFSEAKVKKNLPCQVYSGGKGYIMKIKHKVWFEAHGLTIFGPGRNTFFRQIDECRSLNSAAKKLNVSYRLAWGKIKVAEERLGIHLVEVNPGENKLHLTEGARELLAIFDDLEKEITPILQKAEDKIVALKKKSQKSKALTEIKITAKNTSSDSPAAGLKPEPERQNRLKRLSIKDRRHEENKKIVIKSLVYLYILPFVEKACELFEDYAVIVCF